MERQRQQQRRGCRLGLLLGLLTLCGLASRAAAVIRLQVDNPEDIQNYLQVVPEAESNEAAHPKKVEEEGAGGQQDDPRQPLSVMWGIADTTATVGRLFTFTIPKDAFKGHVTGYKVNNPSFILRDIFYIDIKNGCNTIILQ